MNVAAIIRLSAISGFALSSIVPANRLPEPDAASPIVIDFEDYPANRVGTPSAAPVVDFYRDRGLLFVPGVTALVYDDQSAPADPDFPRSGDTVITSCYSAEFCTNNIEMELAVAHRRVQLWVGYDGRLSAAADLLLIGFDRDRTPVARRALTLGPSDGRIPVALPMSVEDPEGRITSLQLAWADQRSFLAGLSVDDVELTPFVADPATETTEEQPPDSSVTTDTVPPDASATTAGGTQNPSVTTAAGTQDSPVTADTEPPEGPVVTGALPDPPRSAADGLPVPLLVLGLLTVVAGLWRRRRRLRRPPPSPAPSPPAMSRPKIRVRADEGAHHVTSDDKPLVAIRASLRLEDGRTEITDHAAHDADRTDHHAANDTDLDRTDNHNDTDRTDGPGPPVVAPTGEPRR